MITDVGYIDAALTRLCAMRASFKDGAFYRQCDKLLDARNRYALVARLEAEHAAECGLRMIVSFAGWAHCPHCDRDCPRIATGIKCGQCDALNKI